MVSGCRACLDCPYLDHLTYGSFAAGTHCCLGKLKVLNANSSFQDMWKYESWKGQWRWKCSTCHFHWSTWYAQSFKWLHLVVSCHHRIIESVYSCRTCWTFWNLSSREFVWKWSCIPDRRRTASRGTHSASTSYPSFRRCFVALFQIPMRRSDGTGCLMRKAFQFDSSGFPPLYSRLRRTFWAEAIFRILHKRLQSSRNATCWCQTYDTLHP